LAVLQTSCRKQGAGWTTDTLLPLAKSNISISDLFRVEDSILVTDPDNCLKLVYQTQVFDFKLDNFSIPDTTFFTRHANPGATINWDKRVPLVSDTNTTTLDLENVDLTTASIKEGKINVEVTSVISEDIQVTYIMPEATKNGVPLSLVRVIPGAPGLANPSILNETIDLTGYSINLQGKDKNKYNTLYYYFVVEFVNKFVPGTIYQYKITDYINIEQNLIGVSPAYGKGVFHTQTEQADSTSSDTLNVFEGILKGDIDLAKAKISLDFENNVGADFQAQIEELTAINPEQGKRASLVGDVIGKSLNINRALDINGNITPGRYKLEVDESESNIDELIEVFPQQFKYDVKFTLNPDGNVSGGNDFLYADKGITADMNLEIPLNFKANDLTFIDSSEVNPEEEEELDNIFGGQFLVHCYNWFPFDAQIHVEFLDAANNVVLVIEDENQIIAAANPDEGGQVRAPVKSTISTPYTPDRLQGYYKSNKAVFYITLNTNGETHKKIYGHYRCEVKVVADLQYNMNIR
jgi:hypothetical protein